jgi:gamma-glutamylcyclotransferase (GGCT)/AIG2-like uncharacterized protein YtfP
LDTKQVFVYGTLMHKSHCAGWAESAEVAPPIDAVATGDLLDASAYPYADFDGGHRIHGQVLTFDVSHDDYLHMCAVERGAGYVEREVLVRLATGQSLVVMAWQIDKSLFEYRPWLANMPVITSGDWNAHIAERYGARVG